MKYWITFREYYRTRMFRMYTGLLAIAALLQLITIMDALLIFAVLALIYIEEHLRELRRALVVKTKSLDDVLKG